MKKAYKIMVASLLALLAVGCTANKSSEKTAAKSRASISTPTLFFHGYDSSSHAEEHMTNAARRMGATNKIIRANVSSNGNVTLNGTINRTSKNSIVEVNFDDNTNGDYHQDGRYTLNVVRRLQRSYRFNKMNMVGHSMGNMAIMYYLLDNARNKKLPTLNKQVAIAGHFDGIIGYGVPAGLKVNSKTGKPDKYDASYRELLPIKKYYPRARVLNLYGDYRNAGDGRVSNASSKTLKYLVLPRAKSYQEKKFTGRNAQHSRLHSNPQVDRALVNFLWR